MLAETANKLAQNSQELSMETPQDFFRGLDSSLKKEQEQSIFYLIKSIVYGIVEERSRSGYFNVRLEPFASIPANFQTVDVLRFVKTSLFEDLQKQGYQDIDWEIRDGRILLSFGW